MIPRAATASGGAGWLTVAAALMVVPAVVVVAAGPAWLGWLAVATTAGLFLTDAMALLREHEAEAGECERRSTVPCHHHEPRTYRACRYRISR